MDMKIRRRQLLGGAAATLSVAFLPGCAVIPVIPKRPTPDTRAGLSWISHQSGSYVLTLPRVASAQTWILRFALLLRLNESAPLRDHEDRALEEASTQAPFVQLRTSRWLVSCPVESWPD